MKKGIVYVIIFCVSLVSAWDLNAADKSNSNVNHFFVFGDITSQLMEQLIAASLNKEMPLRILINSPGGDIDAALSFYNSAKRTKPDLKSIGLGTISSAAMMVFCSAEKRVISKNGYIVLHSISTEGNGLSSDVQKKMNDFLSSKYADIIASSTGGKLKTEQVLDMMKKNTFISGEEAFKLGIATELLEE